MRYASIGITDLNIEDLFDIMIRKPGKMGYLKKISQKYIFKYKNLIRKWLLCFFHALVGNILIMFN